MKEKIVCITGASSGIGWATAHSFATQNKRLILCGRRKDKLEELQKQLDVDTIVLTLMSETEKLYLRLLLVYPIPGNR